MYTTYISPSLIIKPLKVKMVGGNDSSRSYSLSIALADCLWRQGNKDTQVTTIHQERVGSEEKKTRGEVHYYCFSAWKSTVLNFALINIIIIMINFTAIMDFIFEAPHPIFSAVTALL